MQEVLKFIEELTINMGKNVKFKIQNVEENELTSWVHWHLGNSVTLYRTNKNKSRSSVSNTRQ